MLSFYSNIILRSIEDIVREQFVVQYANAVRMFRTSYFVPRTLVFTTRKLKHQPDALFSNEAPSV